MLAILQPLGWVLIVGGLLGVIVARPSVRAVRVALASLGVGLVLGLGGMVAGAYLSLADADAALARARALDAREARAVARLDATLAAESAATTGGRPTGRAPGARAR